MSTEKTDALVIRLADFSESSRVVTLFTRDFGKISCLAKGAKRLKSAFEAGLDLLSECRIVFIHKSSSSLDLLTESQLVQRFHPSSTSLTHLYCGYYIAELLNTLTEEADPHPELYEAARVVLAELASKDSVQVPLLRFELAALKEIGQLPDFETCTICHSPFHLGVSGRFWVSQGGLICAQCGRPEYDTNEIHAGSIAILQTLAANGASLARRIAITPLQSKEVRKVLTSAITHVLGRRPKTLGLISGA